MNTSFTFKSNMISIAQAHYNKIIDLIRMLHKNMELLHPSSQQLADLYTSWSSINQSLTDVYKKISQDLQSLMDRNNQLQNENKQLNSKLQYQRTQNNSLIQSITMQRAQLAKNQAQLNRYKDGVKKLKESTRQKMVAKQEVIAQLQKKVRKYKKISEQQEKKFEKLDKKITQITQYQIAQRSSLKEQQLDNQLLELEKMCDHLEMDQDQEALNQFQEQ